jgi:hypothetical protein
MERSPVIVETMDCADHDFGVLDQSTTMMLLEFLPTILATRVPQVSSKESGRIRLRQGIEITEVISYTRPLEFHSEWVSTVKLRRASR